MNVSTVGLDLAKNVFQVHAIDESGEVIVAKALRRRQMMPFFSKLYPGHDCQRGENIYRCV